MKRAAGKLGIAVGSSTWPIEPRAAEQIYGAMLAAVPEAPGSEGAGCKECNGSGLERYVGYGNSEEVQVCSYCSDREARAWAWLDREYGSGGNSSADRDYSSDEMVDAFLAGAAAPAGLALNEQEGV